MVLKKINASSILEVVIATTIISTCFCIGVLVYSRSTKVIISYEEIRNQTKVQSILFKHQFCIHDFDLLKKKLDDFDKTYFFEETDSSHFLIIKLKRDKGNQLWEQEILK